MLHTNITRSWGVAIGIMTILILMSSSLVYGYTNTTWADAFLAFFHPTTSNEHIIIRDVRFPRAVIAAFVGACLGVSGAIMQSITRNPLSSPSILGVNAGASFFVVVGVVFLSVQSLQSYMWLSFAGATFAFSLVFILSSTGREGLTPLKLTLAGSAITALFASFTQGLLVLNETALDQVLFWLAGSVANRPLDLLVNALPYMVVALLLAFVRAKELNVLSIGDDVAVGLGQRTAWIKFFFGACAVVLAGSAVAVAGPIGFVGIIIPHLIRSLVGLDHRWILPYSAMGGAALLLLADIGGRYVLMPRELPVGVMTALIGVPFFIFVARRKLGI
ncbi:FecCD family ABC transporter permease [Paenisporosarcina antarctica]|uniref:Iron ABC transporter permease n=1 Tax=Paenisporosarcina antarctica TaxID=417367 RepID=A0A4P6ZWQ5_9BACL|nr:iron ABC transporter permease [Paenisporosarcina antarctica]QBP39916.1 iron ABC transporter permease [Paenisporosarcina antarctica]